MEESRRRVSPVQAKIRPVRLEDAEAINEIRRQPSVLAFTTALPSETVPFNRKYLEGSDQDNHLMVAEVEGRVVGMASLHIRQGRQRHGAGLGIMIHDDFQGKGIGRGLMENLLDLADNYLGLSRAGLDVMADNARAVRLYEALGFELEGRKRRAVLRGGEYVDLLIMARLRGPARSPPPVQGETL